MAPSSHQRARKQSWKYLESNIDGYHKVCSNNNNHGSYIPGSTFKCFSGVEFFSAYEIGMVIIPIVQVGRKVID